MILRAFGVVVGLVTIAFGLAVIGGALVGTGPCRVNCDLYMSIIRLVGQAHYNRIIGWCGSSVAPCLLLLRC